MIISDLHIHSRFSRATSTSLNIANLEKYAKVKGVDLLGTGDFTHPEWIKEIKTELKPDGNGIYKTKTGFPFILSSEVSLIYTDGRGRRVHLVVFAPDLEVVQQITEYLKSKGRVDYDGRPIFNISCPDFVYELKKISDDIEIIPAHIWTPWFGLLGSKSGFDSFEEAFKDQTKHINALETGMSSDPPMNWRLSQLDKLTILSFSDLHSYWPWRIGREATIFDFKELSYNNIIKAIRTKQGLLGTVEVDPGYGKYHVDGHRNCKVSFEPKESKEHNNICPVCKRPLTIGVMNRVEELADRPEDYMPKEPKRFYTLIPLSEIISVIMDKGIATKNVWNEYYRILKAGKSEFDILLNKSKEDLLKVTNEKMAQAIIDNRVGKINVKPGYDGVYGIPLLGKEPPADEPMIKPDVKQKGLNEFI